MISLVFVFWIGVVIMATVGAVRGWAKELLVTFSAILALFIIKVFETFLADYLSIGGLVQDFWPRTVLFIVLTFFGYQTPGTIQRFKAAARREKLQDSMLGFIIGGLNGYFVIGSLWHFLNRVNYNFPRLMQGPDPNTEIGRLALQYISYLPPEWLLNTENPTIYFAVVIAFTFVLIVFI